jgi:hypothetical protein
MEFCLINDIGRRGIDYLDLQKVDPSCGHPVDQLVTARHLGNTVLPRAWGQKFKISTSRQSGGARSRLVVPPDLPMSDAMMKLLRSIGLYSAVCCDDYNQFDTESLWTRSEPGGRHPIVGARVKHTTGKHKFRYWCRIYSYWPLQTLIGE